MDKIIIKGLKIYAYHGVNPEEKIQGQEFILDITCKLDLSKPCRTDCVDDTVSYAHIVKLVQKVFKKEKYDLIEKVAQTTADAILNSFPSVEKVKIELKKPQAPIKADFEYVSVVIKRSRDA